MIAAIELSLEALGAKDIVVVQNYSALPLPAHAIDKFY